MNTYRSPIQAAAATVFLALAWSCSGRAAIVMVSPPKTVSNSGPAAASPQAPRTMASTDGKSPLVGPIDNKEPYAFGQQYMRVYLDGVYVPRSRNTSRTLFLTLTTQNKRPLTFKFALDMPAGETYSARSKVMVIPAVALNSKAPIEIVAELRTKKDISRQVGLVQGLLKVAADVFTGGAASTISRLTQYANSSSALVQSYQDQTQSSDFNQGAELDDSIKNEMVIGQHLIVFTKGQANFGVTDANNVKYRLKEMGTKVHGSADALAEATWPTPYRFIAADSDDANPLVLYPTGDVPYVVLTIETYVPYPSVRTNARQIPVVRDHFRVVDKILAEHHTATDRGPQNALISAEAGKLYDDLLVLTDAGDVSISDAHNALLAFLDCAKSFGGADTGYTDDGLILGYANAFVPISVPQPPDAPTPHS